MIFRFEKIEPMPPKRTIIGQRETDVIDDFSNR